VSSSRGSGSTPASATRRSSRTPTATRWRSTTAGNPPNLVPGRVFPFGAVAGHSPDGFGGCAWALRVQWIAGRRQSLCRVEARR
jgi:hypothetical protein